MDARVVEAARAWLGTPYHHQGSCRGVGTDCLGLIRGVWRDVFGVEPELPPAYSADWAEASGEETLLAAAGRHLASVEGNTVAAGHVLVFRFRARTVAKHVGIATGTDRFIHAAEGVAVSEVYLSHWWRRRIAGVFQFPE